MVRFLKIALVLLLVVFVFPNQCLAATTITSVYDADDSIFANPERGFLHFSGIVSTSTLQSYRIDENITLIMINQNLGGFVNGPINQATLDALQTGFNSLRAAGVKAILRFSYTNSELGTNASLPRIISHIDQLAPLLQANSDVIALWQAGFIGAWGEWYYTSNSFNDFGNQETISSDQWLNRKAVVDKMLSVLPNRAISLRTPLFKRTMYADSALTEDQAFNSSATARIGHHNDAFVANSTDFGTYRDVLTEYPYLEQETKYVPMGGENNNFDPSRSTCAVALAEMAKFHWSYINIDYYVPTISNWTSQGCIKTMEKNLGYRFVLQQASYPVSFSPGESVNISLTIKNEGYAAPFNPRPLFVVLFNIDNSYIIPLNSDPRLWKGGSVTTVSQSIAIPANIALGKYKLGIWLPDEELALRSKPYFSIRFANANIWDSDFGYNILSSNIKIGTSEVNADVSNDGIINIIDIGIVIDNYMDFPIRNLRADINKDGTINIVDIGLIIDNYDG